MSNRKPQAAQELEQRALEFIRTHVDLDAAGMTESHALFLAQGMPAALWPEYFRFTTHYALAKRAGSRTPTLDALDLESQWYRDAFIAVCGGLLDGELAIRREQRHVAYA